MIIDETKLKILMLKKKMRNTDIARITGLNPTTISNITRGLNCSDETAQKIANALGCSINDFRR